MQWGHGILLQTSWPAGRCRRQLVRPGAARGGGRSFWVGHCRLRVERSSGRGWLDEVVAVGWCGLVPRFLEAADARDGEGGGAAEDGPGGGQPQGAGGPEGGGQGSGEGVAEWDEGY